MPGSSSIKFGVFDAGGTPVERCSGIVEDVGSDHSRLKLVVDGEVKRDVADLHIKGHGEALANIRDALAPQLPGAIAAVGHRVVHGGASILGGGVVYRICGSTHLSPTHRGALVDDAIVGEAARAPRWPLYITRRTPSASASRATRGVASRTSSVPDTAFHTPSMHAGGVPLRPAQAALRRTWDTALRLPRHVLRLRHEAARVA